MVIIFLCNDNAIRFKLHVVSDAKLQHLFTAAAQFERWQGCYISCYGLMSSLEALRKHPRCIGTAITAFSNCQKLHPKSFKTFLASNKSVLHKH